MRVLRFALVGALSVVLIATAAKAERTKPNIRFFSGAQDAAHWTADDTSEDGMSFELKVGPATGGLGTAGFELTRLEGTTPPATEPSFEHKEDREGLSGGSPRLVIELSDGGNIYLRPDEWSTDWLHVGAGDGDGNWDSNGGTCTFQYDKQYQEVLACHPGALVTRVVVVTDSNWLYVDGYTNWIDDLQYNGWTFSHARDNNNAPAA